MKKALKQIHSEDKIVVKPLVNQELDAVAFVLMTGAVVLYENVDNDNDDSGCGILWTYILEINNYLKNQAES